MKLGITGLPKTGKTTIFNLVTGSTLDTSKFAATVEDIHRGIATVPDERLDRLEVMYSSRKKVPASIEFLDFAGLSLGSERESKLVGDLRNLDAFVHVLRAFDDPEIPHPAGSVNPARDAENHVAELILNDLIVVESRLERLEKQTMKMKSEELMRDKALMLRIREELEANRSLREVEFSEDEKTAIRGFGFLSFKPMLFALNVGEDEAGALDAAVEKWGLGAMTADRGLLVCPLCANAEEEIGRLAPEERALFLEDLGITTLGSIRLIRSAFELLGLITFFTAGEKDAHAWTVRHGSKAPKAAGAIHSDMEKGFIRMEVVHCEDLLAAGSEAEAKKRGVYRLEGKEYQVNDGDVVVVRFNI